MYINRLPGEGVMEDLFIVDERDPGRVHTVVAKRGKLFPAKGGKMVLRLYDGTIHGVDPSLTKAQNAQFETYDFTLDAGINLPAPAHHQASQGNVPERTSGPDGQGVFGWAGSTACWTWSFSSAFRLSLFLPGYGPDRASLGHPLAQRTPLGE